MKSDSQSVKIYTEIRKKILANLLLPKTRLKEDVWAKKLEVNRMAVREALNRLLGERLVTSGEKGGYFVASITEKDIHQIRELREILEVGALRLCIKKVKSSGIAKLQKICDDFTAMVEQGYQNGAIEADLKFHKTLIELAGNEKLLQTYKSSHIILFHLKLGKTQTFLDDFSQTDREHRKIVQYIKEKKIKLAEDALIRHFERGEAAVLDLE
jgi:DNA-binding GntR family transcriptional regulator